MLPITPADGYVWSFHPRFKTFDSSPFTQAQLLSSAFLETYGVLVQTNRQLYTIT